MPILNIPVKEWGADLAEQAKRKAQAAMQQVQDAGGDAIAESQRQAKEARDEWMKTQIDAAMNPIREAGHAAAEGLSALGDRAQEAGQTAQQNLQQNASAVAEAPVGQAIGEKASGLGTFAQGVRQDLRKGADAAVAADTAMDTALSERDAADRASAPTIPEEVSAPPSFRVPGALPAMTADTLPNPVEFPTNVAKNYLGSMGKSAEDLTDPEELGRTASAAQEIAPEVQNPSLAIARAASDPAYRDELATKKLPAAGQVLKTVGDIGNVVPNVGEQLENVAASVALEATKDTGLPDPVKAGIAMAAGSGVPTNLLKRAFKVPGGLSSQLDEAGRAAMGNGKLAAVDGAGGVGDIGDIPEPTKMPDMHRPQESLPPSPDAERARIPEFDREAFPAPGGGPALRPGEASLPEGSRFETAPDLGPSGVGEEPFPSPHNVENPIDFPRERTAPFGGIDQQANQIPLDEALPPARSQRAQQALEEGAGSEFYRRVEAGEFDHLDDKAFNKELISDLTEPGESADQGLFSGTRPMEGPFPDITQRPPGMGGDEYGRSLEAPPLDELGPERSNFRVPGSGMSVADQIAGRTLGAVQGGIAGDRQDENDTGWQRLGRIGSMAALGAAAPPQNVKAASLARGLLRNADRLSTQVDGLGVRAGAVENPGRPLTEAMAKEPPESYLEAMPDGAPNPVFYSKLERALDKLPRQGTAQQMLKTLQAQGVKPDELRWNGIEEYLDLMDDIDPNTGKPMVVSLDELRRNVEHGQVRLRESVRERPTVTPQMLDEAQRLKAVVDAADEANVMAYRAEQVAWDNARANLGGRPRRATVAQDPEYQAALDAHSQALDAREAARAAYQRHLAGIQGGRETRPKYEDYTQPRRAPDETGAIDEFEPDPTQPGFDADEYVRPTGPPGYREIVLSADTPGRSITPRDYDNPHFDATNTPLHMRVSDRTLPDGRKVLHIEEMQSDWHQAAMTPLRDADGRIILDEQGKPKRMGYAGRYGEPPGNEGAPPQGPWSKSWSELGMKRALRMAAEEGYDGVSWTPALVHQQRYGQMIPERFEKLEYDPDKFILYAHEKDGWMRELGDVTPQRLPEYVGPDLAQRMLGDEPMTNFRVVDGESVPERLHILRGDDLTVTNPGSKGFDTQYEKVMPQAADALGKPWGQKSRLGEIELSPGGDRTPAHVLEFTPEMRKGVTEQGFPLFIRDQQGGRSGMGLADQIAGRAAGAIQGGVAADRSDEDDTGWERAGRIATGAALGAAAKPANVNLASLARGAIRNADKLGRLLGDEAGEAEIPHLPPSGALGITSGAPEPAPKRGRPRSYTEDMRTPPTRPPKSFKTLPSLAAIPNDLVAEEAMEINSLAGKQINAMRDAAKAFDPGPERDAALDAADKLQGSYIGAVKGSLSPEEKARYDVEYNLQRQARGKRLDTDNVRSGNSGADPVPSQIDTEEPPTGAPTSGPAEGTGTPSITRDTGDMGDEEGVTVTETPAEAAARERRRQRALEEEGSYDQDREDRVPPTPSRVASGSADEGKREAAARATQRAAAAVETKAPVAETPENLPQNRVDMGRVEQQATAPVREGADPDAEAPPEPVVRGPEPGPQDRAVDMGQAPSRVSSGSADEAQRKAASQARASGSEARSATPLVTEADIKAPEQPPKQGWWARNRGGIGEWANTLRYSGGLLANPATAGADFAASTAEVPWVYARNRLMDIPDSKAKWVREAEEMGLTKGYKVGSENMGELFRTGKELRELTPGAAPEDVPQSLMRRYREEGREGMANAAGIMETPLRVRNSLDALTHGALYTQDVYRQAAKAVNKTSIEPGSDLWWKQVQEFVNKTADKNLATDTPEYAARKHALLQADRSLGRNDAGALGETLSSAFKNPVMKPFFPLFKTGYNLSVRGLERSPLGVGGILFDKALGREVSAERIMDTAMGTPITAAMALYAVKSGNISGYGPDDQKTRDDLVAQGWRPFSIRTPDGRWHSYTRAGVASAPLAMAGAIGDAVQYAPPDAKSGDYMKAVGKGFGTWFGNNFLLRSVGDLGDLAADPIGKGEGYFGRMASQYTGTSSLLGTPASMLDPYQRNTAEGGVNPFVNEMIKNIPVLRQNVLEPKYDTFGKPLPNPAHGFGGLNPYTPGPSADEIPYSTRNLRRYGGSHSAAEDGKIAAAIAAWEANIEGGPPPGPEANRYISKYLGTDNVDYDFAREDAKDAEDARAAARLGR